MAAPVNANINILVNTQQAMAQLRALQSQVATLNNRISATSGAAAAQQAALAKAFKDSANASRMWNARIVPMNTAVNQFSDALDKGRMSLGQYTRYAASQLPGMSRVFRREFEMMTRVAEQNVRQMQTQYVQLGNSATGAAQAMALTPTALNKHAASAAIAAQRQMMFNRMIDLGTTKLLNWGKNTQWAGRQLMVGFSIPLAMVGAVAAKAFKEIDKGSIAFRRVYGDLSTTTAEMERNLEAVKALGNEYTRYGLKLSDTIELAADVAATGAKNESLLAATEQTLRLSTLGLMEYGEALDATIALQTAFQVSNEDLAGTIDFLNVVENETILTMQDMAAAIPRVAPVVKGLGGDVKDLAVFMTAMREGGVTAEQGANALKSGLGRLINPTKAAKEVMAEFGMSIEAIIQANRGDLMGMMQDFGKALSALGDFEQQQVLEKVFGKYQYARLGALFKNLSNDASQANRTIELTNMSMEDLAAISERELSKIEEATSVKFQAAVERLKVAIAPVGEQFMKALMPVIDFVTKLADKFNDLPDNIKNAIAIGVAAIAGIGPIVLMTVGLIANGIANIGKLVQTMRKFFARLRGDSALFNYLTQQEREATTAANALGGATDVLTGKFLGQRRALESLTTMLGNYTRALSAAATAAPTGFGMGNAAAVRSATAGGTVVTGARARTVVTGPGGMKMAKGGVVPGTGNGDTVPAMLTPGESVITKEATQKYGPMIQAMNAGIIPGFQGGVTGVSSKYGDPQSSLAKLVFAHGQAPKDLTAQEVKRLKEIAKGSKYIQQATRMQGLSNFGFIAPESFNRGQMTGRQAATLFNDPRIVDRTMYPIYQAIARQLGQRDVSKIMNDPAIQRDVRGFARNIGRGLALQATKQIDDPRFYKTVESALAKSQLSPNVRSAIEGSKNVTTVAAYGGGIRDKGERIALGMGRQKEVFGATGGVSYKSTPMVKRAAMVLAGAFGSQMRQSLKIKSPSKDAEMIVTQYVDGLESGAAKNTGDAAKAGRVVGNSFASSVKQSILSGQSAPGLIPGAAKREYMAAQSASRREAYNIKRMQQAGMTDAQIIRQLDRLEKSKQRQLNAEKRAASAAQRNASLAAQNAALAQQTGQQMSVEQQARKRGLRTRMSEYFATPVGDGTQTRGQAMRARAGSAAGGAVMGLMGLSMAASFAGGQVGEMAQKVMPVTMGLMGLQMILPMLTNPIGLAIIAVAGLTAAIVKTRMDLDKLARTSAEAGANIGGIANGMKILEEATGLVVPKPEDRLFRFTEEDRQAMSEFGSYFESEGGSKFIQDLKEATSEERYQKISYLLAQGIASGMDQEKAKAFGMAIAEATGDSLLNSRLLRDFAAGVFKAGSDALIQIEKQRLGQAPNIRNVGRLQAFEETMPTVQGAGTITTEGYFQRVLGTINVFKTFTDFFLGNAERFSDVEQSARGLGFALETSKNLANIEAVLAEERRNGLIDAEEYAARQAEINELQRKQSSYIGKILSVGADSGALQQAFGQQLTLQGFNTEQVGIITERVDPEKLAQRFFNQSFNDLSATQRKYVEEVFTRVLSGITPENVSQRLADIEGTYTEIARKAADAMLNGVLNIDSLFNAQEFSDAIRSGLGVRTGFTSAATGQTIWDADILANNLEKANEKLLDFNTDSQEVLTTLMRFEDVKFARSLLEDEDDILRVGKAIQKLAEYENISIEFVLASNIDPADVARSIKDIERINLDTEIFGPLGFEADKIVQTFMNMGVEVDQIPGKLRKGVVEIDKFGKKAVDKLGRIRPKVMPQIIANVFGKDADNPEAIASALDDAFPNSLTPIDLAIILSLAGNEAAIALLSNPQAIAAAKRGETQLTQRVSVGGERFQSTLNLDPLAPLALTGDGIGGPGNVNKNKDTSGGGGTKSFLENLKEQIAANLQIFVKDIQGSAKAVIQKLRALKIPEQLIEAMGTGPEGLANMREFLAQSSKAMNQLLQDYYRSISGEQISDLIGQRRIDKATEKSAGRLRKEGFSSERIGEIISNPEVAQTLAALEVGSKEWERYINNLKSGEKQSEATKKALDPLAYTLEEIAKAQEDFDVVANRREAEFQSAFGNLDREYKTRINAQQDILKGLQDQRDIIQEQIDDLEQLNSLDQRSIRDKQREIELLERRKQTIQDQIDAVERQNELDQRRIDTIKREDELRNRVSDALNQELDIMSDLENKIRDSYQERIDALDKIAEVNDYIINQQKNQLNLSQALSEGDIYAATSAAQEMRAASGQFAVQQTRAGIEQAMESQIAGLRTSEGLTREQAEQRIQDIQQQSYQTSLMIRDIEDEIYQRNLSIVPLKDSMRAIDEQILGYQNQIVQIQDRIYGRETEILNIQLDKLSPLDRQITAEETKLSNLEDELQSRKDAYVVDGLTYDQHQDMIDQQEESNRLVDAGIREAARYGRQVGKVVDQWALAAQNIAEANRLAREMATNINTVAAKDIEIIKADESLTPSEAASGVAARRAAADAQLAEVEARRQERIGLARQRAMDFQRSVGAYAGGLIKYAVGGMVNPLRYTSNESPPAQMAVGGSVLGSGSRDSIAAMLTPGEFVVRKAMVDKYGVPMLNALNQGSFGMPRYNVGQPTTGNVTVKSQNTSNIMAPMYNNYSVNVSVSNANASADEIANRTITKIKQMQDMQIRSGRGY